MKPRRSILYMPGANVRAMQKAKELPCDTIIFDLEDAVSPEVKELARAQVLEAIGQGGYGYRELLVRVNGLDTEWGLGDINAFAGQNIDGMLFPKVECRNQVTEIVDAVNGAGGKQVPIWLMIETPTGVLDLAAFADHPRVEALVMGTSDLVKELRAAHIPGRANIQYALQHCVLVSRRFGKDIFDGVHLDFRDEESLRGVCEDGRAMGFDGKTLIHPSQISVTNEVFGYSTDDVVQAERLLEVWRTALGEGKGVAVLDGKLVENLHAAEAQRVVAFAEAIEARSA